jgi:hypothetical protein
MVALSLAVPERITPSSAKRLLMHVSRYCRISGLSGNSHQRIVLCLRNLDKAIAHAAGTCPFVDLGTSQEEITSASLEHPQVQHALQNLQSTMQEIAVRFLLALNC